MICWLARRRMIYMSPSQLSKPGKGFLANHLRVCPSCDRLKELWIDLNRDLILGADPEIKSITSPHTIESNPSSKKIRTSRSILRKLDWWIAPELTVRWTASLLAVIAIVFYGIDRLPSQDEAIGGFGNKLIIAHGHVEVTLEPATGIHLNNTDFSPTTSSGDTGSELQHDNAKGVI